MSNKNNNDGLIGSILALLDLPKGSLLNFNGVSLILKRDDFIGFHSIPSWVNVNTSNGDVCLPEDVHNDDRDDGVRTTPAFHFITVRAGAAVNSSIATAAASAATTVGFVLFNSEIASHSKTDVNWNWTFLRKYDPRTEEMSSQPPIDEERIYTQLCQEIHSSLATNMHSPTATMTQRVVPYPPWINQHQQQHRDSMKCWYRLTNFIASTHILRRRGILSGDKLIPGSYQSGEDDNGEAHPPAQTVVEDATGTTPTSVAEDDGKSATYPAIPVIHSHSRPIASSTNNKSTYASSLSPYNPPTPPHHTKHVGTRLFLKDKSPQERTAYFTTAHPPTSILNYLIEMEYDNSSELLLADLQLSYIFFLNLHCFLSWTHWRDLVSMLSLVDVQGMVTQHIKLYSPLFLILLAQIGTMEDDFFSDMEYSDDENALVPSWLQLIATASAAVLQIKRRLESSCSEMHIELEGNLALFIKGLCDKFPSHFTHENLFSENVDALMVRKINSDTTNIDEVDMEDDLSEEGPTIVSMDEVNASLHRSILQTRYKSHRQVDDANSQVNVEMKERFPLLVAAMDPYGTEDLVMVCARVVDQAVDVSLVREAAAYLEQVEATKQA